MYHSGVVRWLSTFRGRFLTCFPQSCHVISRRLLHTAFWATRVVDRVKSIMLHEKLSAICDATVDRYNAIIALEMSFEYFKYKGVNFSHGLYTEEALSFAENEFEVLDDDVYIVTYPKSGTNWMIEILSLLRTKGDPTWCNSLPIWLRSPWYETIEGQSQIKDVASPRVLTSHLPIHIFAKSFFTSKAKIIYVMRNPKDILVSLFYFSKMVCLYKDPKTFPEFFENFLQGKVLYSSWFDHVKGWMQMKDNSNFFFITYEELHGDLRNSVIKICDFLGKDLDDSQIDLVVKHSSFNAMKENKMSNYTLIPQDFMDQTKGSFMRKGITGDWKNHFTVAQNEYFDEVFAEKMKDLNMTFFKEQF